MEMKTLIDNGMNLTMMKLRFKINHSRQMLIVTVEFGMTMYNIKTHYISVQFHPIKSMTKINYSYNVIDVVYRIYMQVNKL